MTFCNFNERNYPSSVTIIDAMSVAEFKSDCYNFKTHFKIIQAETQDNYTIEVVT